jgi:hypothetical protein
MLHEVSCTAPPMIHFTRSDKPEIVLFGEDQEFGGKLLYVDKGLTIRSSESGGVQILRYQAGQDPVRQTCTSRVADVFRTAAALGCDYGDLLKLAKDATSTGALDSRLVIHAVPQLNRSGQHTGTDAGQAASDTSSPDADEDSGLSDDATSAENAGATNGKKGGLFGWLRGE